MAKLIERARGHFLGLGRLHVDIPEWPGEDGAPTRIHFRPLTLNERRHLGQDGDAPQDGVAKIIIAKATDADGKQLFTLEDLPVLKTEVSADILARIFNAIMAPPPAVKDIEKN